MKDVLKRAVVNQYQVMLAMPFLLERIQKRLEIERKYAARQTETLSQEQRYEQLPLEAKSRFGQLKRLCSQIQENYKGLSAESQNILAEQTEKFDAILATALRRLWLVQKYEHMVRAFDANKVKSEMDKLKYQLGLKELQPRVREALEQNFEIKGKLLETAERNVQNRTALLAEIDSVESLLQLLLQKSLAATDAQTFSADIDDILSQAEADAASIREMEQLMGSMPELSGAPTLSERVREQAASTLPFVPRDRQKR